MKLLIRKTKGVIRSNLQLGTMLKEDWTGQKSIQPVVSHSSLQSICYNQIQNMEKRTNFTSLKTIISLQTITNLME